MPSCGPPKWHQTDPCISRQGREQPIGAEPREYVYPRISPNGKRIALDVLQDTGRDIWMWDLEHDILGRLTLEADKADKRTPIWSADGRTIIYSSTESGRAVFLRRSADGTGPTERLVEEPCEQNVAMSVSPDGNSLVYLRTAASYDIMLLPLGGDRKAQALIATPKTETNGEVSPNGKWIAYESDESGRREIYVRPFPAVDTGRWQISTSGGTRPAWSRNARELFYRSADQHLATVSVEARPEFTYGRPTALFDLKPYFFGLNGRSYDVAADGRFVLIKEPPSRAVGAQTIVVVEHWMDEVRARLGKEKS